MKRKQPSNSGSGVQAGVWRASSASAILHCVQVTAATALEDLLTHGVRNQALAHEKVAAASREGQELYAVRDSKDPHGPALVFTPAEWDAFIAGV